jgi:hypothetical protein
LLEHDLFRKPLHTFRIMLYRVDGLGGGVGGLLRGDGPLPWPVVLSSGLVMHCAARFMPLAASHCATVAKAQLVIPDELLRQTGAICASAADDPAISAAIKVDEANSLRMRDLRGYEP